MFVNTRILVRSDFSLVEVLTAIIQSYWAWIMSTVCPKRSRVVIRYYVINWRYFIFASLFVAELFMMIGLLTRLYMGDILTKPLALYIGEVMFYSIVSLLFIELEKIFTHDSSNDQDIPSRV